MKGSKMLDIVCLTENLTWLVGLCQLEAEVQGKLLGLVQVATIRVAVGACSKEL